MSHALIVDDDTDVQSSLADVVTDEGLTAAVAGSLREARIQMTRQHVDLILADLNLPDGSGMELFDDFEGNAAPDTKVVVVTGMASIDSAVKALRVGAADYLVKPIDTERLRELLRCVRGRPDFGRSVDAARGPRDHGDFGAMLGRSPAMQRLYEQVARVAPTQATVLLIGESGTGKELAARAIHDCSPRCRKPYLALNCGAISLHLIESEMFGHERGSFTGADRQHIGHFERADGGTLFLDEITEMPVELQVKLLRVLETGKVMRIGTTREVTVDVRIIAATNREPEVAVEEGKLRSDLYHRLNVFPLRCPPLRERDGDVEVLAGHFLEELNRTHGTNKVFAEGVLEHLAKHRWHGNVRELRNFVQRAWILANDEIETGAMSLNLSPTRDAPQRTVAVAVGMSLAEADRRLILATLKQCGGVRKNSAELLGISLKTLYNRLEQYRQFDAVCDVTE